MNDKDKSIAINSVHDLSNYGLMWLTGEVDPFALRVLVDVNEQGKQILEDFFGFEMVLKTNWNSTNNAKYSIMLPHDITKSLMLYILFYIEKRDCAYPVYGGWQGYTGEEYISRASEDFKNELRWNPARKGNGQNTNRHEFTGRVQA